MTQGNFLTILRKRRDFRLLWLGQIIARLGDIFYWLALLITVNELTSSTLAMGFTTISLALPQLLLGLPAGVLVDRFDRRKVMIASDVLRGGLVLFCLLVGSREQVWIFYLVGFLMSAISVFFFPARQAVTPSLVAEEELLGANALLETSRTMAMLMGAAAAGFVIAYAGAKVAFILVSVSFLLSAIFLWAMHVPQMVQSTRSASLANLWAELRQGLGFVRSSRLLTGIMIVMTVFMLGIGAINVLWVPFMDRLFDIGPEGLGIADSLQGLGMLLGSIIVGNLTSRFRLTRLLSGSLALFGLAAAAIGLAPTFVAVLVLLIFIGLSLPPINTAASTLVQTVTPHELMGRVNSASGTMQSVANLLSMELAATLVDLVGVRTVFVACGLVMLVASGMGWMMLREPDETAVIGAVVVASPASE
jgi:MFS family permease